MGKQFKTAMFGYDKKEVDEAIEKMENNMELLVEDTKAKIKQAQNVAANANKKIDELEKELKKIKKELDCLKKQ